MMAQQQQSRASGNADLSRAISLSTQQQQKEKEATAAEAAMFHDFLGMKPSSNSSSISNNNDNNNSRNKSNNNEVSAVLASSRNPDASPSASQSLGASSAGGRGASDLATERQVPNHLEGVPYYAPRSDLSVTGSKRRSSSDSGFTAREGVPQIVGHDSSESLHLMKMLRKAGSGERPPKRSAEDDQGLFSVQATRPSSAASLILQPSATGSIRSLLQCPRGSDHYVPFAHQINATRFGGEAAAAAGAGAGAGPSGGFSQAAAAAADEGSRTGIKGPGLLSSINACSTGVQGSGGSRPRPGARSSEPEASTPLSRECLASASRQMTIFYGGQAHVFDDVHPNKADVIMALAGSNGVSWSTTYTPKPALLERELRRRLPVVGSSTPAGAPSTEQMMARRRPTGGHFHGGGVALGGGKESRNQDRNVGEGSAEDRRAV